MATNTAGRKLMALLGDGENNTSSVPYDGRSAEASRAGFSGTGATESEMEQVTLALSGFALACVVLCVVCLPCLRRLLPCCSSSTRRVVPVIKTTVRGVVKVRRLDDSPIKTEGVAVTVSRGISRAKVRQVLRGGWLRRHQVSVHADYAIPDVLAAAASTPTIAAPRDSIPVCRRTQHRSARAIQRRFRQCQNERFLREMDRHHGAVLIQCAYRDRLAANKKHHAARHIQMMMRPNVERWQGERAEAARKAANLHAMLADERDRDAAAAFAPSPVMHRLPHGTKSSQSVAQMVANDHAVKKELPWESGIDAMLNGLRQQSRVHPADVMPAASDHADPTGNRMATNVINLRDLRQ